MKKISSTIKTLISLIVVSAIVFASFVAYGLLEILYPNAMLNLKKEFLYMGSEIALIEYDRQTDVSSLEALLRSPKTVFNNSMILVSSEHPITDTLVFDNVSEYMETDLYFDKHMHVAFSELSVYISDNFGEKLYVTSAFRTQEEQQMLYNENGPDVAQKPGESEHQTGLAVDVAVKGFGGSSFLKTDVGKYVNLYSWKFGFIIRYPDGKESITKISYEPWHIRYVGEPHAEYISKNRITLEEYLDSLSHDVLYTYDTISSYAVTKVKEGNDIITPKEYTTCVISPDNCGNYIVTFELP